LDVHCAGSGIASGLRTAVLPKNSGQFKNFPSVFCEHIT